MAIEGVPWMVAGGLHSAEVGRQLAFAATQGATGTVLPEDLKVSALPTPGPSVRISSGGAAIASNFPGASGQSYIARGVGSTDIAVAKAGTSTTTRYVIIRITDPAYAGQPTPAKPAEGPYAIPDVVASITNLAYPFIALAKIVMPANTVNITNAMITDMREVANPRTGRVQRMSRVIPNLDLTTQLPNYQNWPSSTPPEIDIPAWATRVQATLQVFGVGVVNAGTLGDWELVIGWAPGPVLISNMSTYDFNQFGTAANPMRAPAMGLILDAAIPASMRGTRQTIRGRGGRSLASGTGFLRADHQTQVQYDVWFAEDPA